MERNELLQWHLEAGVDETIGDVPVNHFDIPVSDEKREAVFAPAQVDENMRKAQAEKPAARASLAATAPSAAIAEAKALADSAETVEELEKAVRGFEGCALKKLATNTVFSDGNRKAKIMVIGEAPGAQEDLQGIPFCGPSGQLLDKMLGSIGLDRTTVYISNTLFWRPPGNRQPSKEELAICQPFVEKHIALMHPKLLVLSGGTAVGSLLQKSVGITKLRGQFHEYQNSYMKHAVPTAVLFHPSYLLRSPGQKRLAWHDMLLIRAFLAEHKLLPKE